MHQRQGEKPVGARADADPFVGDGAITAAHRIDRDEFGVAARLQLAKADLDRIGIMILGDAPHHEIFGMVPIGFAEFPERAAKGI